MFRRNVRISLWPLAFALAVCAGAFAQGGGEEWVTNVGHFFDHAAGFPDGSSVLAGAFSGSATFGSGEAGETVLETEAAGAIFIVKYSPDGRLAWAKKADTDAAGVRAGDIAAFSDGSFVLTGSFYGSITFGPGESGETVVDSSGSGRDGNNVFVAKYRANGSLNWAKRIVGADSLATVSSVAPLSGGSSLIDGSFRFQGLYGSGLLKFNPDEANEIVLDAERYHAGLGFLAKVSANGTVEWARQTTLGGDYWGARIVPLQGGAAFAAGAFRGEVVFGPGEAGETVMRSFDSDDRWIQRRFLAKYRSDGTLEWVKRPVADQDGSDTAQRYGIAAHADGSLVEIGTLRDVATFGFGEANETVLESAGGRDIYVAKFQPNGTLAWARRAGGTGDCDGRGVFALPDGSALVSGWFRGTATFGPGEPGETTLGPIFGDAVSFIAKYREDGSLEWAKTAPRGGWIAPHSEGFVLVAGSRELAKVSEPIPRTLVGEVVMTAGAQVFAIRDGENVPLAEGDEVYEGDLIETGADSRTQIQFTYGTSISLGPNSRAEMAEYVHTETEKKSVVGVLRGWLRQLVPSPQAGEPSPSDAIRTLNVSSGVRGTDYTVEYAESDGTATTKVQVDSGEVEVTDLMTGQTFVLGPGDGRTFSGAFSAGKWTLSVLEPDGQGETEPEAGAHFFNLGAGTEASATPADGWKFVHWLLDGEPVADNPVQITAATGARSLKAVFAPEAWILSVLPPDGEGSTAPALGDHAFGLGEGAQATASPADGWLFRHWLLDGVDAGQDNPLAVAPGEDGEVKTLQAVFVERVALALAKVATPDPSQTGGEIEFVITYSNPGEFEATEIVLRDAVPANTEYVEGSASDSGEFDAESGAVVWLLGSLAPGGEGEVSFRVRVGDALLQGGTVVNADYTIDAAEIPPVSGAPVEVGVRDTGPPSALLDTPAPGTQRAPRDTAIVLEVSDPGIGVNLATVNIAVDGEAVFDGAAAQNGLWTVRYAEDAGAYRFYLFRSENFPYGHSAAVQVSASDNAGNVMAPQAFAFRTLDRPFGAPLRVNAVAGAARGRPALASAEDGTLFAAWEQGGQVWTARLLPGARAWAGHGRVHPSNGGQRNPSVAYCGGSDTLFVAWEGYGAWPGIYVVQSADQGETWNPHPDRLDDGVQGALDSRFPALAAAGSGGGAGSGKVHAAWASLGAGGQWTVVAASSDNGGHWTVPEPIPGSSAIGGEPPALAVGGATGDLYAVWTQQTGNGAALYASVWSQAAGWAPAPAHLAETPGTPRSPALAAGASGGQDELHLVWAEASAGVSDVLHLSFRPGAIGGPPLPGGHALADEDARRADQVRPAVALRGPLTSGRKSLFVAWQDGRSRLAENAPPDDWDVFLAEKPEGGEFGQDVLVHPSGDAQEWPVLTMRDRAPVVLFAQRQANGERADALSAGVVRSGVPSVLPVTRAGGGELAAQPETRRPGIVVPPGAVEVAVDISVAEIENPPPPPTGGIGAAWDFSPSGLRFDVPITVDIPVTPEELRGLRAPYRVYWYNEDIGDWDPNYFDGEYLRDEGVIRFFPTHFTVFSAAGNAARRSSSSGGCTLGGSAGLGDAMLLLLPWTAAVALAVRRRRRA